MERHPIFNEYERVQSIGTGKHMFDFLGSRTDTQYKGAWAKYAIKKGSAYTANYPVVNEHYFDWIGMLLSVFQAQGTLRIAELGAGWAPWLVSAAYAAKQNAAVEKIELLGVEADPTHYDWMVNHFKDNGLNPDDHYLLKGAVSATQTVLKFPKIDNPDEDYGASTRAAAHAADYIEVQGITLTEIIGKFSGKIDFMHIDIQGAEYDVLPQNVKLLEQNVKSLMLGTHISLEKHYEMTELFKSNGWSEVMNFERNGLAKTKFGEVQFGDGFQLWQNSLLS